MIRLVSVCVGCTCSLIVQHSFSSSHASTVCAPVARSTSGHAPHRQRRAWNVTARRVDGAHNHAHALQKHWQHGWHGQSHDRTAAEHHSHRPHGGVRIIENSMTTSRCMKRRSRKHIDIECARRPLLLAAGRAPLQHLFHKEKEAIRTYTGLRKHEYRSRVHVRSSAVEGSRLANKAKSDGSDGIG